MKITVAALMLSTGCASALDGDWQGGLECGSWGDAGMSFTLAPDGTTHIGTGQITDIMLNDDLATLAFEIEVERTSASGAQPLDMDLTGCTVLTASTEQTLACSGLDDVEWDGHDVITGTVGTFLTLYTDTDVDCEMAVTR